MSSINLIIVLMFSLGIILIIYSLITYSKQKKERDKLTIKLDEAFLLMNDLFDKLHDETDALNTFAQNIFNEANEKHDELLTIYQLIDSKINAQQNIIPQNETEQSGEKPIKNKNVFTPKSKHSENIYALYDEGNSVEEIAKMLSIGQGEIEFLLNLREA